MSKQKHTMTSASAKRIIASYVLGVNDGVAINDSAVDYGRLKFLLKCIRDEGFATPAYHVSRFWRDLPESHLRAIADEMFNDLRHLKDAARGYLKARDVLAAELGYTERTERGD